MSDLHLNDQPRAAGAATPASHTHDHPHDHAQCRHLLGSLSDYVDGDLADEICEEIERHMAGCERCQIVVDTLRKTVELYHTTAEEPAALPEGVRQRLFFRLDLDQFVGGKEPQSP